MRRILEEYARTTSFHGFARVADVDSRRSEKLFWALCTGMCFVGSTTLLVTSYGNLRQNAISFAVETSYLNWTTKFPTIYVCDRENERILQEVAQNNNFSLNASVLKEVLYFDGALRSSKEFCKQNEAICASFHEVYSMFRRDCKSLLKSCAWKSESFDCCEYFLEINTDFGTCYGLNSVQIHSKKISKKFNTNSSAVRGLGHIFLEINGTVNLYLTSEEDVPLFNEQKSNVLLLKAGYHYKRRVNVHEVSNDEKVRDVDMKLRKCAFPEEVKTGLYPRYSYTTCLAECRWNLQNQLCNNCVHAHLWRLKKAQICQWQQYDCLEQNYQSVLWKSCDYCLPSCTEMDVSTVSTLEFAIPEKRLARIEVILNGLPAEKYRRYAVKDRLDLVVMFGGSFALFLGGSVLSFAELLYYFTVRLLSDYVVSKGTVKK